MIYFKPHLLAIAAAAAAVQQDAFAYAVSLPADLFLLRLCILLNVVSHIHPSHPLFMYV
jgi:hypothetical protein